MDQQQFDALTRAMARRSSRRRALATLLGAGGLAAAYGMLSGRVQVTVDLDDPIATAEGASAAGTTPTPRPTRTPTRTPTAEPDDSGNSDDETEPTGDGCRDGLAPCGAACIDPLRDSLNCGGCGYACRSGEETCVAGTCTPVAQPCTPAQSACDGACVDLDTDPNHCGSCDVSCDAESEECVGGACRVRCEQAAGGLTEACEGVCVDLGSDPEHCGSCDTRCGPAAACRNGQCENVTCTTNGEIVCGSDRDCVDPLTDRRHCGECGNFCRPGQACHDGACGPAGEEGAAEPAEEATDESPNLRVVGVSFRRPQAGYDFCTIEVLVRNDGDGPAIGVSVFARIEELVEGDPNKYPTIGDDLVGPTEIGPGQEATYSNDGTLLVHQGYPVIHSVEVSIGGTFVAGHSSPYGTVGSICEV
jgi:hypothetical protein